MQIIEARNDILKLSYSPFQNGLLLSDFLLVSEGSKSILAQVIGIESSKEKDVNIATLKGCLSVDETGKINPYIGFTPSTNAEIAPVAQEQVISMLCAESDSVIWGYLAQHDNILFKTEKTLLENKPLILMDDYENYNVITSNIIHMNKSFGGKSVVIDFDGSIKIDNAFYVKLGDDLKIPLSYKTLNYIYENDLQLEALSTQAIVQDIINELQEYIKTLPDDFLPFSTVKNVIYAQYEENKIPELMLFKNKFVKYAQQEIFAESANDFNFLNETIADNDLVVIDATDVEPIWHKLILDYLAKEITEKCFFLTKLENDNSNKKTILDIYNNHLLSPVLTSSYTHEYVNVMKSIAKNMILFPPKQQVNDFATYTSFMQKLSRDEYVVCGENTLYLSFLLRLTYIDTNMSPDYIEKEIQHDVDKLYRAGSTKSHAAIAPQENTIDEIPQEQTLTQEQPQTQPAISDEPVTIEIADDNITEEDLDFLDELDGLEELDDVSDAETQTLLPEENSEILLEELLPTEEEELNNSDINLEEYYAETTENGQEYQESPLSELQPLPDETQTLEDEIETSDIPDLAAEIDIQDQPQIAEELPEQEPEITQEQELEPESEPEPEPEPEKPITQSPAIPVYSVPELEVEAPIEFSEGNFVFHEKYGKGVIEKIMNYGNKTLCSIQFEEVGRRLLDPNLAGLKQV